MSKGDAAGRDELKECLASLSWQIEPWIEGASCPSASDRRLEDINPADESLICLFGESSSEVVQSAVESARAAFDDGRWANLTGSRRQKILFEFADLIAANSDELALLDCVEMGKPISAARHDTAVTAPCLLRSWADFADKLTGDSLQLGQVAWALNTYEPRGVVLGITPWNFPTSNAIYKIGPALAAGNSIILKPSEIAPSSALLLARLATEAGVPNGVFNVVPGSGATGSALAGHPDIDMVSFTGSTATGRSIMSVTAQSGKPVLMECGGKSPQIVFDDVADLEFVARAVVQEAFWNQGQVCSAGTRLLASRETKDRLVPLIVRMASEIRLGDPLDPNTEFGPLASPQQRERVLNFIQLGREAGAYPALLGEVRTKDGCYVGPTIFDHVDPESAIAQQEIFGPVLIVQPFSSDADAVRLANATQYGLSATVWTRDLGRAKRMARAIRAGGIMIRTSGEEDPLAGAMPSWEPRKASGFGAEIGLRGLQSYSCLKAIIFNGV